ncbi:UDP-N-acetylmuramoyl-L-alanyl-D-glutamate--2,6-diaminopimelate ligase, partial [Alphaproteobacteria bacterium]|nr:UDP-N-acetylmuramoyl-L-alanyl-D-glutamate--2,6-diaminopimelate ligase [Alphaproteobacteria bacterium]
AHEFADNIIITDDNPRNESPQIIRAEIMAECPNAIEIGNRDEAIAFAIQQLQEADCLLIAGKGHESLQLIGSETLPFSDAVVARNTVKRLAQSTLIEEISK